MLAGRTTIFKHAAVSSTGHGCVQPFSRVLVQLFVFLLGLSYHGF